MTRIRNAELLRILAGHSSETLERVPMRALLTQGECAQIMRCSVKKDPTAASGRAS